MEASRPQILIAGCGAIGSIFGCLLRKAGHDVTLLGREWHLKAIRSKGLDLDGLWGGHHAGGFKLATELRALPAPFDLILVSVKAYHTEQVVKQIAPLLKPSGIAISLQNGLGNVEILAEAFGPQRSLGANILVGAKIPEPGRVTVTVQAAPIILGPLDPHVDAMEKCGHWVSSFNQASIPCEPTDQILSHLWAKVFYNAPLNPLGALLEVHYGALGEEPELRALMDRIISEAFEVAATKEVRLLWKSAEEYRELFYTRLLPATYNHQSSMLQDLQRGRPTEINSLNAKVWRYGRESGIPTPFNETMTRLMLAREKGSGPRGPSSHRASGLDP